KSMRMRGVGFQIPDHIRRMLQSLVDHPGGVRAAFGQMSHQALSRHNGKAGLNKSAECPPIAPPCLRIRAFGKRVERPEPLCPLLSGGEKLVEKPIASNGFILLPGKAF